MTAADDLVQRLEADAAGLERELAEIDLLISQARNEAGRHEARRATAAEKLAGLAATAGAGDPAGLANQVVTLTRRAALMEAQVDVLDSKRRALVRLRDVIAGYTASVHDLVPDGPNASGPEGSAAGTRAPARGEPAVDQPVSRLLHSAQEDLRREIARAMHDGPAQSLTNIVLQAEIVEQLVRRDPTLAEAEVRQLVAMVQQTLEATKAFIFDVRPMVLDDLGLVPTLRRASRDRGRRAGVAVEFDSIGVDRRLPVEMESGIFRILDEALVAYVAARPDRVTLHLDWGDVLAVDLRAVQRAAAVPDLELPAADADLPPALAGMVEDRRVAHRARQEAARQAAIMTLPARVWREITDRAAALAIGVELLDEGARLRVAVDLPAAAAGSDVSEAPAT
jgi:two-component system sensor histidine kinase DegS